MSSTQDSHNKEFQQAAEKLVVRFRLDPTCVPEIAATLAEEFAALAKDAELGRAIRDTVHTRIESAPLNNPQIGQTIPGKGIFAGVWEPKDRDGESLGKVFNVFAAPEDLTVSSGKKILVQFKDAAERITALRNWHGHDGGNFENDAALYRALRSSTYQGEWFIPSHDLLNDKLYANKDKGDFKGTFATNPAGLDVWYWSCTQHRDLKSLVWNIRFSDGDAVCFNGAYLRLSCRPCRVEPLNIR